MKSTRERRTLTPDEFARFLKATETGPVRAGLSGHERAMLYLITSYVGFRASEMASLTPQSFDIAGERPAVTVEAAYSKRRRKDVQLLRMDLAERLSEYLADKPASQSVDWSGSWWKDAAEMIPGGP